MNTSDATPTGNQQVIDSGVEDDLHRMADKLTSAVNMLVHVQQLWCGLDTPLTTSDARMMHDLMLDATIATSGAIALMRRIEHKKRYPDAFLPTELPE